MIGRDVQKHGGIGCEEDGGRELERARLGHEHVGRIGRDGLDAGAAATSVVTLDDDVISTDSDGNLSLSGSIEAIAARG